MKLSLERAMEYHGSATTGSPAEKSAPAQKDLDEARVKVPGPHARSKSSKEAVPNNVKLTSAKPRLNTGFFVFPCDGSDRIHFPTPAITATVAVDL